MLNKLNYPLVVLLALCCRDAYIGASIGDAIVACALVGLISYRSYLKTIEHPPIALELRKELDEMKSTLNALKVAKTFGQRL